MESSDQQFSYHERQRDSVHTVQYETIHEDEDDVIADDRKKSASHPMESSESSSSSASDITENSAIDGGFGWVIVMASFFNAFIIDGIGSSFGLLLPSVVDKFGASAFVTSFAASLFVSFLIMGSISAELVKRLGFRSVSMAGGVLGCVAFVIASFSPSIILFIVTYGFLAGCSCGLVFLPSIIVVNTYFHRKRGIANGIITSGSGAGLLVLAPLINIFLEKYSLDGTVLILGGVLLNMCVFSSFYFPPAPKRKQLCCLNEGCLGRCGGHHEGSRSSIMSTESLDEWSLKGEDDEDIVEECNEDVQPDQYSALDEASQYDSKSTVIHNVDDFHTAVNQDDNIQIPVSYKDYALSLLQPGVSASDQKHKVSNQCENRKTGGKRNPDAKWRSEYQLNSRIAEKDTACRRGHSSVHNIPSWCKDQGQRYIPQNSIMKQRRPECHKSHDHHPRHSHKHHNHHRSHHHQLSNEHGSNLYLTGSISTLMSFHYKHIIQSLQGTVPSSFQNNDSRIQISVTEVPPSTTLVHETESIHALKDNVDDCNYDAGQTKLLPILSSNNEKHHSSLTLSIPEEMPVSKGSISTCKSGYTSLNEIGAEDVYISTDNIPVPLPAVGYTIKQLLCMPSFHLFSLGASLIQVGYPIAGTFLADFAYHNGLTASHIAFLMGLLGGLNIIGRLLSGALASLKVDPLHLNNASLMLGGLVCLLCPFYSEFWSIALFAGLFGFFLGFFPPLQPLIIVEYFGINSLASAFGFLTTIKGVASVIGAPLAGCIYDVTGQYSLSFVFAGAVFVLSSVVHCFMPCSRR